MTHKSEEQTLTGGNTNVVTKVGNTVRRKLGPHSNSIHRFLHHLNNHDVPVPRLLGIDDENREILRFIDGETDFPADMWQCDRAIVKAAEILRAFHDASKTFQLTASDTWAFEYPEIERRNVICHNDFAPYNMVFRDGCPIAIIDFDLCGPGPAIRDLAYLAYWMAPLSFANPEMRDASLIEVENGCPRLQLLCRTYGTSASPELLTVISEVLHHMSSETMAIKMVGPTVASRLKADGHLDHWMREAQSFDDHLPILQSIIE